MDKSKKQYKNSPFECLFENVCAQNLVDLLVVYISTWSLNSLSFPEQHGEKFKKEVEKTLLSRYVCME